MEDLVTKADMRAAMAELRAGIKADITSLVKLQITAMVALTAIFAMIVKVL